MFYLLFQLMYYMIVWSFKICLYICFWFVVIPYKMIRHLFKVLWVGILLR